MTQQTAKTPETRPNMDKSRPLLPYSLGMAAGMITHALLLASAMLSASGFSYFGISDSQVAGTIRESYSLTIAATIGAMLLAHLCAGGLIGLTCSRFMLLLFPASAGRRPLLTLFTASCATLVVHAIVLAADMSRYPQLYVEHFHAGGGVPARFQQLVCNGLFDHVPVIVAAAFFLLWLVLEIRSSRTKGVVFAVTIPISLIILFNNQDIVGTTIRTFVPPGRTVQAAPEITKKQRSRPNILIFAADSLRTDRIGCTAPDAPAPTISRLALEGLSFSRTYTVLPRTFPSWVSMLSGLYPYNHGITTMFPGYRERMDLPPTVPMLLARQGYATAVVSDFAGDMFSRVDLGFQHIRAPYFHFPTLVKQRLLELDYHLLPYLSNPFGRRLFPVLREFAHNADPKRLTDEILELIPDLPEPWMILVFYGAPHFPYAVPAPYYRMFTDPDYQGTYKYHTPHELSQRPHGEKDYEQIRGLYDGAVRAVDDQLSRLLSALASRGSLLDRTIMVITADHGENLHEADLGMGHGDHLYGENSLRIPLIFWNRNGLVPAGREPTYTNANVDLAPTLLTIGGVADLPVMDGISLLDCSSDDTASKAPLCKTAISANRPVLVESGIWFSPETRLPPGAGRVFYPGITELAEIDTGLNHEVVLKEEYASLVQLSKHRALYSGGRKIIYMPTTDGVELQLYDPLADPLNTNDLMERESETAARLKTSLTTMLVESDRLRTRYGYLVPTGPHNETFKPLPAPGWLKQSETIDVYPP